MAYDGTLAFDTSLNTDGIAKGSSQVGDMMKGMLGAGLLQKGLEMIVGSLDDAIKRFDTMRRYPKVMEQLGYSSDASQQSINKLSMAVHGLPTHLDEIASSAQRMAVLTGNLDKSTDASIALNDALLASGSSAEQAASGQEQYIQMLSTGRVDMQSWKILQQDMGLALTKTANAMGYTGQTAQNDLYKALQSGEKTFTQFQDALIQCDKEVGGFATMARTASDGIETSWGNMKAAVTRGVAGVIGAIDDGLKKGGFGGISDNIQKVSSEIDKDFKMAANGVKFLASNLDILLPIVTGTIVAFKGFSVMSDITKGFKDYQTAIGVSKSLYNELIATEMNASTSQTVLAAAMSRTTTAKLVEKAATEEGIIYDEARNVLIKDGEILDNAQTLAIVRKSGALTAQTIITSVLTGETTLATAATELFTLAWETNPIGIVIGALALLVAGLFALNKVLEKNDVAFQTQKKELEDTKQAYEDLTSSTQTAIKSAREEIDTKKAISIETNNNIQSLLRLIDANDKNGRNNQAIQEKVKQLNAANQTLGLSFDANTNSINMTNDSLKEYGKNAEIISKNEALKQLYNADEDAIVKLGVQLDVLKQKQSDANDKIEAWKNGEKHSIFEMQEVAKAFREYGKEIEETTKQLADATAESKVAQDQMNATADQQKIIANREFDIRNNSMSQVQEYAKTYHMSAEQIIHDASQMEGGLDDWYSKQQAVWTDSGMNIEMFAEKWNMTTDQVSKNMSDLGVGLNDYEKIMESTHTKNGESIDDLARRWGVSTDQVSRYMTEQGLSLDDMAGKIDGGIDDIANKFEKLPDQVKLSGKQMVKNFEDNVKEMEDWQNNLKLASEKMPSDMVAYFQSLGPSYNSALKDLLANPDELNQLISDWSTTGNNVANGYVGNFNSPANQAKANQAGQTMVNQTGSGMQATIPYVSSVAQDTANTVTDKLNQVPYQSSTAGKNTSKSLGDGIKDGSQHATDQSANLSSNVSSQWGSLRGSAYTAGSLVIDGMSSGMNTNLPSLTSTCKSIANAAINQIKATLGVKSPSQVTHDIFTDVMLGGIGGLLSKKDKLLEHAKTISSELIDIITINPDMAADFTSNLSNLVDNTKMIPLLSVVGASSDVVGGSSNQFNLTQNITTPKALSPYEITKEGQAFIERAKWQLP